MIVLRNKSFSEEEEVLRKQIREDKKKLKKGSEKRKKMVDTVLEVSTAIPGALTGFTAGEYIKNKIDNKLLNDTINLYDESNKVKDELSNFIREAEDTPNSLNLTLGKKEVLDRSEDFSRRVNKNNKLRNLRNKKLFKYGLPLGLTVTGGTITKILLDKKIDEKLKRNKKSKSFSDIDSDAELGNSLIVTGGSGLGAYAGIKYHKYKDKKDLDKLFEESKEITKEKTARINKEYEDAVEKFKKDKEKIRFKSARDLKLFPERFWKKEKSQFFRSHLLNDSELFKPNNPLIDQLNYKMNMSEKDKKGIMGNDQSREKAEKEVLKRFKKMRDKKITDTVLEGADEFARKSNYFKTGSVSRLMKRIAKGSLAGSAISVPAMIAYESTKDPEVIKKKRDNNKLLDSAPSVGAMIGLGYGSYKSDPIGEVAEEIDILNEPKKSKRLLKRIKQSKKYIVPTVIGSAIGYGIKKVNNSLDDRKKAVEIRNRIKESEARLKELEKNKKK